MWTRIVTQSEKNRGFSTRIRLWEALGLSIATNCGMSARLTTIAS